MSEAWVICTILKGPLGFKVFSGWSDDHKPKFDYFGVEDFEPMRRSMDVSIYLSKGLAEERLLNIQESHHGKELVLWTAPLSVVLASGRIRVQK